MKLLGLSSMIVGLIGILVIVYLNYRLESYIKELGSIADLVSFFPYTELELILINTSQFLGIAIGTLSIKKFKSKFGWIGLIICILNLIIIFFDIVATLQY